MFDFHTPIPQLQVKNHRGGEQPPPIYIRQKKPNRDRVNMLIVRLMVVKTFSLKRQIKRQINIRLYLNILFFPWLSFHGSRCGFFCVES